MTWDRVVDIAQIVTAVGAVIAGLSAIAVAFIVTGREDRRQRESERRALQRQFVVELQDAWLDQDARLTDTISAIQAHHSASQRSQENSQARMQADENIGREDHDALWQAAVAQADEVNTSGERMVDRIIELRAFARRVELIEARIVSGEVKKTSFTMRRAVEKIVHSVGNAGNHNYYEIKERLYGPAFQRFIDAGYQVLSDLESYPAESEAARKER